MKILIVTAVFSPEPVVSAKLSEDLANELSKTNMVSVISPKPTRPYGFKLIKKNISKSYSHIKLNSYTYQNLIFMVVLKVTALAWHVLNILKKIEIILM